MKPLKQLLLIAPMLFILFASGCSKNLIQPGDLEPVQPQQEIAAKPGADETPAPISGIDSSARQYEKPEPRGFGAAEQGMPGGDATGSFSAEPLVEDKGLETPSRLYEKPEPRSFGTAQQGMPGGDATGSFSAEPYTETRPEPAKDFIKEETVDEFSTPSRLYEKPEPRSFGAAKQGMPGYGTAGSFSAEPFIDERGEVAELPKEEEVRRKLPYRPTSGLQDIHFAFDKYDLTDETRSVLTQNADYLKVHPNARIEIQGHCDERGSNNYNITLGERRAQSTKSYLVAQGIDEGRIHTISYGEERPFCFESNEKCWHQNRRGHFLVAE